MPLRSLASRLLPHAFALAVLAHPGLALAVDTDGDGLSDADEVGVYLTDPNDPDTDDDLLSDGFEVAHGFDPLDSDEDSNDKRDGRDDTDADGLANVTEQGAGTDPHDADTDDDGLLDGEELATGSFGPVQVITTQVTLPTRVVAADVDGDGDLDVLSSSWNEVAWYENTAGSFGPQQVISAGFQVYYSVAVADVDGDGDLDALSTSNNDDRIAWYENTDGAGSFGAQQVVANATADPIGLFAADADGDGDPDVFVAFPDIDEIAWYENTDGAGSFGPRQVISTAVDGAWDVFAADLDGDGDPDVLSASIYDDKIAWYENTDGAGSFGSQQIITVLADHPRSVFAADLDGDEDLDVAASSVDDDEIAWYENTDGAGSFGPQQILTNATDYPFQIVPADVDGDGDTDVLAGVNYGPPLVWLENSDGAGSFASPQVVSPTTGGHSLFAADFDGDGDTDVVSSDFEIGWYEQQNLADPFDPDTDDDGLLDGEEVHTHGTAPTNPDTDGDGLSDGDEVLVHETLPLSADSDGDDLDDGVEVAQSGTDPNDADTDDDGLRDDFEIGFGFDPLQAGEAGLDPDADGLVNLDEQTSGSNPSRSDSDGDGLSDGDEVHLHGTNPIAGDSDGDRMLDPFEMAHGFDPLDPDEDANGKIDGQDDADGDGLANAAEQQAGTDPLAGDSDTDGLLDGQELAVGSFLPAQVISTSGDGPLAVAAADLDGDGDLDVLAGASTDDAVSWFENTDGMGGFGAPQLLTGDAARFFPADIDDDGDLDVVVADAVDDKVAWYENEDGAGSFGPAREIATGFGGVALVVAVDLDGDGDRDVLSAGGYGGEIAWYANADKQGSFGQPRVISNDAPSLRAIATADVDGDGDQDLLVADSAGDTISSYENTDGMGTFGAPQVIAMADLPRSIFAADLDGDGDPDLVCGSSQDDTIAWYENTAGAFGPKQPISTVADAPSSVFAADLDGDGDLDVISASSFDDTVSWYANTDGAGAFGPPQTLSTTADSAWSVFAADLDGDGDTDVLSSSLYDDTVAWYERLSVADPLDIDTDDDGLSDYEEVVEYGTLANRADTDGDLLSDFDEIITYASDPFDPDTDDDGLADGAEVALHGTSPTDPDTDGDSFSDGDEVAKGYDPLNTNHPNPIPALPWPGVPLLGLLLLVCGACVARQR